jgi:SAM-dependent methyltransferase
LSHRNTKDARRLFHDLSWIWPIMSPPEDYVEETEFFSRVIKEHSKIEVKTLLHLGCGGGRNDYTFKKHFDVTGIDISEEILKIGKDLNPEVHYLSGDMRSMKLERTFDAVAAFDSINYMKTEDDLHQTFLTAHEHLNPGGVFLTVVEENRERFKQHRTIASTHSQGDVHITFIENSFDPEPEDTHFEMTFIYLVRKRGQLEIHSDSHLWGLFAIETWRKLLEKTGFQVEQIKFEHSTYLEDDSLPMFVCLKPAS